MPNPSESGSTSDIKISGINDIDALILGSVKWGTGHSSLKLTYSFPTAQSSWAQDYAFSSNITNDGGFKKFSDAQQIAARNAISVWGEIANLGVTEIYENSVSVGDIRVAFSKLPDGMLGIANNPQIGPNGGDVWISNKFSENSFSFGSFEYLILLHELGHALGLKHPFSGNPVLPSSLNNHQFSIMSLTESSSYSGYIFPKTPMIYDIQAIQYIYGANMNTRTEDNIYSFSPSKLEAMTIWDAGGQDTLSAFNQNLNCILDLREGKYSSIGLNGNIGIALGVTIENAIGSAKNDTIIGNKSNNFIDGGYGIDTVLYEVDADLRKVTENWLVGDKNSVAGIDTLANIERIGFKNKYLALDLDSNAGVTVKILGAVFGKESVDNKSYVGIGLHFLDSGWTYDNLAALALDAAGAKTNDEIVSLLWKNVIGTQATSTDKAPYIALLENGTSPGALAHLAADSSLNTTNINLVGLLQTGIEYTPI
jgi:serralysin